MMTNMIQQDTQNDMRITTEMHLCRQRKDCRIELDCSWIAGSSSKAHHSVESSHSERTRVEQWVDPQMWQQIESDCIGHVVRWDVNFDVKAKPSRSESTRVDRIIPAMEIEKMNSIRVMIILKMDTPDENTWNKMLTEQNCRNQRQIGQNDEYTDRYIDSHREYWKPPNTHELSPGDARMSKGKWAYARRGTSGYYSVMPTRCHVDDKESTRKTPTTNTIESKRTACSGIFEEDDDEQLRAGYTIQE